MPHPSQILQPQTQLAECETDEEEEQRSFAANPDVSSVGPRGTCCFFAELRWRWDPWLPFVSVALVLTASFLVPAKKPTAKVVRDDC